MEKKVKRSYTKEYQIDALRLASQLRSTAAAAKQLGISPSVLHIWKTKWPISINGASQFRLTAKYAAEDFRRQLAAHKITASISRKGN